jgi:hypothetical protein
MNPVLLNVAIGKTYIKRQQRLQAGWKATGSEIPLKCWTDCLPPCSPWHRGHPWPHTPGMVPYRFKIHAIQWAIQQGYDAVIWCDASIVPVRSLRPILKLIAEHGYWLVNNGWSVGEWVCDTALAPLGITREESFQIPLCTGGAFALNLAHGLGREFYQRLLKMDDTAFYGPWTNGNGEASADKRVRGHRHDQTVMSVIAWRLRMQLMSSPQWFAYGDSTALGTLPEEVILVAD